MKYVLVFLVLAPATGQEVGLLGPIGVYKSLNLCKAAIERSHTKYGIARDSKTIKPACMTPEEAGDRCNGRKPQVLDLPKGQQVMMC